MAWAIGILKQRALIVKGWLIKWDLVFSGEMSHSNPFFGPGEAFLTKVAVSPTTDSLFLPLIYSVLCPQLTNTYRSVDSGKPYLAKSL